MKTKKLTVLIMLVAIIGTVTSVITQDALASFEDTPLPGNVICSPAPGNIDLGDTHEIRDPPNQVFDGTDTDLTVIVEVFGPVDNGDPTVPTTNDASAFLIDTTGILDPRSLSLNPPADLTVVPRLFTASFSGVPDGIYDVVFCLTLDQVDSQFPDENLGTKHSAVLLGVVIDNGDPVVECSDFPDLDLGDDVLISADPVPRGDDRLADFFNRVEVRDDVDPDPVLTDSIPDDFEFPIGTTPVVFTAEDASGNRGQATCSVTITSPFVPGCEGAVQFDPGTNGETMRQICAELTREQAECGVSVVSRPPTIAFGDADQGGVDDERNVTDQEEVFLRNNGNSPTDVEVSGTDWTVDSSGGKVAMLVSRTHFSDDDNTVDLNLRTDLERYNDMTEMDKLGKLIIDDLAGQTEEDTFYRLQIVLEDPDEDFGGFSQTLTYTGLSCGSDVSDEEFLRND